MVFDRLEIGLTLANTGMKKNPQFFTGLVKKERVGTAQVKPVTAVI